MKDSFILFTEYKEQVDMLTDEQAGILFKAIFCYSAGEALPPMDAITKMAFSFIRSAMDRADDKYQRKVDANRENGRRGGRPAKNKQEDKPAVEQDTAYESDPEKPKKTQKNPKNRTVIWVLKKKPKRKPKNRTVIFKTLLILNLIVNVSLILNLIVILNVKAKA